MGASVVLDGHLAGWGGRGAHGRKVGSGRYMARREFRRWSRRLELGSGKGVCHFRVDYWIWTVGK